MIGSSRISTVVDRLRTVRSRGAARTAEVGGSPRREITPVRRELVPEHPVPGDVSLGYDGRTGGLEAAAIDRFVLEVRELRFVVDETHYVEGGGGLATLSDAYEIGMIPFEPVPLCETVPVPTCGLESIQLLYAVRDLECECECECERDREAHLAGETGIVETAVEREIGTDESYEIRLFVRLRRTESGHRLELHDAVVSRVRP